MKKIILLFSHTLTDVQMHDAMATFGVEVSVALPKELQTLWSNVPAELESLGEYLQPFNEYLKRELNRGDVVLVQGDFGATYAMVSIVRSLGGVALYATTKRNVVEELVNEKIVKISIFEHVRFRVYE